MVSVKVSPAGKAPSFAKALPIIVEIPGKNTGEATVGDVKSALSAKFRRFYPARQKLSLVGDKKALDDDSTLAAVGITDGGEVLVKDLGPQISWKTVFLVEYVGPLIIHPIFFYGSKEIYGRKVQHSALQQYIFVFVMLHFLKRELETLFVHRFSHGTMPLFNIFKNSAHYHIFTGLLLAFDVYRPKYSASSPYIRGTVRNDPLFLNIGAAVLLWAELSNFSTHMTLRNLRPAGTKKRGIPYGYGFGLVSCPNYFFEIVAWLTVCALTNSMASYAFAVLAVLQMSAWAVKKHKAYKKEFGKNYPAGRKAIIPFIF